MKLKIVHDGPCEGHPCDTCSKCKRGYCCRKDNPDYRLPTPADWDQPVYGERGVLLKDENGVECHACGEWYKSLQTHIMHAHDLTVHEYKSIFDLKAGTGLRSEGLTRQASERATEWALRNYEKLRAQLALARLTPEQLSDIQRSRRRSTEEKHQRESSDWNQKIGERGKQWRAEHPEETRRVAEQQMVRLPRPCRYCGTSFLTTPSSKRFDCGADACKDAKRADSSRRTTERNIARPAEFKKEMARRARDVRMTRWSAEEWGDLISEARGWPGGFSCVECGAWVVSERWTNRKTCGGACVTASKRRRATESPIAASEEARAKIAAKAKARMASVTRGRDGRFPASRDQQ